jgi:ornithine cyclodeaminase/alanine dehydrogenase-like protein (mu-crystallin family)
MLILSEKDIELIAKTDELVDAIERAYLIQDNSSTCIPERLHLSQGINTFLVMPGLIKEIVGTKLVSVNPANKQAGIPSIYGVMVLNDRSTGEPIAMLNGSKLTAVRTGAVGAAAVKYLGPSSCNTLGIIGTGVQAYYQAYMICEQQTFSEIVLYGRNKERAEELRNKLIKKLSLQSISIADNVEKLVLDSDVVVTATTSNTPVFDIDVDMLQEKTFIAIGSYKPSMQEIPHALIKKAGVVFVDTMLASEESGDLVVPLDKGILKRDKIIPFSYLLTGEYSFNPHQVNIFKSVGNALFDLTVSLMLYKKAIQMKLGTNINL